jgi:hypothetical protein
MALWKHEEAILDMLDAGCSQNQVAQRGYSYQQIACVINTIGTADRHARGDARRAESIRRGSQALLRAIQRARAGERRAA